MNMDESKKLFRERLLAAETMDPARRERYEKELRMIFEQRLVGRWKWGMIGSLVLGVSFAIIFGAVFVLASQEELPFLARLAFGLGALWGLAWAALSAWIIKRGSYNRKTHSSAMAGMAWCIVIVYLVLFMILAHRLDDPIKGVLMVTNGLVFLIMAAVFMIKNWIEQTELKMREKLLELEYRLAEIGEEMKKK
jgi:MFS family permease